jgi:hypothetical protein
MADWYKHDLKILVDALEEIAHQKQALIDAKGDIERLAAMEKVIAYSALLNQVASWAICKVRYPTAAGS